MIKKIITSWSNVVGSVNTTEKLLSWIKQKNEETFVKVEEVPFSKSDFWFYDDYNGEILNQKRSFFSISGMRYFKNGDFVSEQPVIIQPEIGYLGIICKEINGVLNFLMQAKIEPGNINCVQISPTIQATKSNFTRAHGGKLPTYFEYFEKSYRYKVIYDQIQSEQTSRFYKKRNRNIVILVDEEVEVLPNFQWMTLGQLKYLMSIDNLVNMDTRTVVSGLPVIDSLDIIDNKNDLSILFSDLSLFNSMYQGRSHIQTAFNRLNDYKMFVDMESVKIPLNQLVDWKVTDSGIICNKNSDFSVSFYDIHISGREVTEWMQPLFKAIGEATFVLASSIKDGKRLFLISIIDEIGNFDKVEFGPTVQWYSNHLDSNNDEIENKIKLFIKDKNNCLYDVLLSEEGGRFYHEQNRNVILDVPFFSIEDPELKKKYIWVDYRDLNIMIQSSHNINIQLRNLLSLIKL